MHRFALIPLLLFLSSCGRITDSPEGCVTAFISASMEHNMSKAWALLGSDAQNYYNEIGRKTRRSGKGALESKIKRIRKFRTVKEDYTLSKDSANGEVIKLILKGGEELRIETVNEDGYHKLRNEKAVENLLKGITSEAETKDIY
jgi:hypothetical protein